MSYRLQKDETLVPGFKRIAEEQISSAINELQCGNIYEVRKNIKRLRSLISLLEPALGPIYTEENHRLRDTARRFSALRDLDVSLELIETFAAQYKRKSTLSPQRRALSEKQAELRRQPELPIAFQESIEALSGTRKRIEDWPLAGLNHHALDLQLKKTHKQSRQAFHCARKTRTAEDLHELRKSVKRELNQRRLLDSPEANLQHLSTLLGDHHNLAVLLATVENTSARFLRMTRKHLEQYESEILELASQLYDHHLTPLP